MSTEEAATTALNDFKRTLKDGYPFLSVSAFRKNPGLDLYIVAALEGWSEDQKNRLPIVSGTMTDEELSEIADERQDALW